MRKPIIGVTPLYDTERESIWMLPGYLEVLKDCGGLPVILPLGIDGADGEQLVKMCDGILFTGGQDVDPGLYGQEVWEFCGERHGGRDQQERELFREAFRADMPIFGICRGMQFINVMMGGTLYQDLPSQRGVGLSHRMKPPYDVRWHDVELVSESPLGKLLGEELIGVNSCHHQAIRKLAPGLKAMACATDRIVEALYCPDRRFLQAVQWHPEFSWRRDERQRRIMEAFVEACRQEEKE
ncbi:MAG: gamma-glutamyl-gamma-aminobutyrate hydrolase family protein [Lachnospiraceae bacterium]|jgi:putative glutamine amidotransferase|nr:gamma-glutamyl-gamma-aminobutyrate hydrolase family protein [Lachnospiraceae bacterium]